MAYVLGFFAADGTMISNNRGAHFIEFHNTDKILLIKIRLTMNSEHKLSTRKKQKANHKTGYRLQIGSKEFFEDLEKLGFMPNKSKVLKMPPVPMRYFGSFVRGYFDGDGSVHFKKHWRTDQQKMRWIFSSRFTCGSENFLKDLLEKLHKTGGLKRGFITEKKGHHGFDLVFSRFDSLALFKLMYNNLTSELFLHRKFRVFKKAIQTLYGPVV